MKLEHISCNLNIFTWNFVVHDLEHFITNLKHCSTQQKNVLVGLLKILRECDTNVLNTILQFELNLDAFLDEPINLDAQNTNKCFF